MKFSYRTRVVALVLALIVINVLAFTFTWVDKGYKNSLFYRFTRQRFAWTVSDLPPKYAIRAGWAKVNITPSFNTPMIRDESFKSWTTVHDSLYTRVVVLDNGTTLAAIITVDLLIMPPAIAQELQKRLPALGFNWKNVYLGATNSQHSLGGWASDYMGKRKVGEYNERLVSFLAEAIVKAVALAKSNTATTQLGYTQVDACEGEPGKIAHVLKLKKLTGESVLICSAQVQQMDASSLASSALSRDFAGTFTDKLEKATDSFVLFMVGSIPVPSLKTATSNSVNATSRSIDSLVAHIAPLAANQSLHTDSTLIAQTAPLIQNDPQVRVSKNWRLKPWLVKELYGDYPAELKALRIGKTVFVGTPGGFSDLLLPRLTTMSMATRNNLIITSFNGGNIGQIIPDAYYFDPKNPYPIDDINRFGPHTETFIDEMMQRLVSSLN